MYEIIIELDLKSLQSSVNKKIADGFMPTGGVTIIPNYDIGKDVRFVVEANVAIQSDISTLFIAYAQPVVRD